MKRLVLTLLLLTLLSGHAISAQTWTWPGDIRDHMRDHGVNTSNKSLDQLRSEHDFIHNITKQGTPNPDDYKLLAQCPNGRCPTRGYYIQGGVYIGPQPVKPVPAARNDCDWAGGLAEIRVQHGQYVDSGTCVNVGHGRNDN